LAEPKDNFREKPALRGSKVGGRMHDNWKSQNQLRAGRSARTRLLIHACRRLSKSDSAEQAKSALQNADLRSGGTSMEISGSGRRFSGWKGAEYLKFGRAKLPAASAPG
jgi:hypothetical protein